MEHRGRCEVLGFPYGALKKVPTVVFTHKTKLINDFSVFPNFRLWGSDFVIFDPKMVATHIDYVLY